MPGPNFASVGKSSAAATTHDAPQTQAQAPAVGKTTLAESQPSSSPAPKTSGKLFAPEQRARMETILVGRVGAAQISYNAALTKLEVEKMIEKKEDLPLWEALLIAGGMKVLEVAIMATMMRLKSAGEAVNHLRKLAVHVEHEGEVEGKILGLSEKSVESLVGLGVDKTKEKTTEIAGEAHGEGAEENKAASLSFIEYLRDASMMVFQHVRENKLASASDTQLLALVAAFEGFRHTETIYYAKLSEHIKAYLSSHAKEIGHRLENVRDERSGGHHQVRKETRVAWLINGRTAPQLIYVSKEFTADAKRGIRPDEDSLSALSPAGAYNADENALGLEETGSWNDNKKFHGDQVRNAAPEVANDNLGPVESDLQDVALASHRKRWLQAPQTVMQGPYGLQVVK